MTLNFLNNHCLYFRQIVLHDIIVDRAQPDWAFEFPDRTGPDTQICRTGPALDIHFKNFTHQITEFH